MEIILGLYVGTIKILIISTEIYGRRIILGSPIGWLGYSTYNF